MSFGRAKRMLVSPGGRTSGWHRNFVLPLPSARSSSGGLYVPTIGETSLDPDVYLLRLATTLRNDIADTLGLPGSRLGPAESWLEYVREYGLLDDEYEDDDPEYCQEDKASIEIQEAVDSLEALNECQINANTEADTISMAYVTEIPPENARPSTQPADTENPRKRCASPAYHADLKNGSLRTDPQESPRTEEPVTYLSDRVSKRQCLG